MNIVYIGRYNESEILSGPEKTAKRIFSEHIKKNQSVFIQYFFDGSKYSTLKKLFGKEIQKNNNGEIYTLGLFRILPCLFKFKPEIIHFIAFERFGVIALFYKLFRRVKFVYNAHGIIVFENNELKTVSFFYKLKDKICERLYLKYSAKIIFNSGQAMDIAEKYYKLNLNKCVILANGIDEVFRPTLNPLLSKDGIVKKGIVFIAGAELQSSGMDFLKKLIPVIENPEELYIIGNIIDNSLEKLNKNLTIHFINKMGTARLAEFYSDKGIFLSLNKYDTFSISSAEAMASGLVTIVTSDTGMSRYILSGENGYIIEYDDAEQLSEILKNLAKQNLLTKISGESVKIYEMLSWENVYETYRNIYEKIK